MQKFAFLLLAPTIVFAEIPSEALNHDVNQETLGVTICWNGYVERFLSSTTYTRGIKLRLMWEQGIDLSRDKEFELGHREPIELGGHSRHISNLVLQTWSGKGGAKAKDALKNQLHRMVCKGQVTLAEAQACMWDGWQACALKYQGSWQQ